MIYLDRNSVAMPSVLSDDPGSPASLERAQAAEFFRKRASARQQRFPFKVYRHTSVLKSLAALFHGKCAYCESQFSGTLSLDVEMFRPKGGVTESPKHPGYWWLAATWSNLLIACIDCNRSRVQEGIKTGKANRFPLVDESARAWKPGEETGEHPLLLDPCSDNPEQHLVFDRECTVVSETERGHITIAVLGLNRPSLVRTRQQAARQVESALRTAKTLSAEVRKRPRWSEGAAELGRHLVELRALMDPNQEYAALKRQLIKPALDEMRSTDMPQLEQLVEAWDSQIPTVTQTQVEAAKTSYRAFEAVQSDFTLKSKKGRETYRSQRRQIERVTIRGFKGINELDLDFRVKGGRTSWLMLLGENGTGKSSVLQAIALTLAGAEYFASVLRERRLRMKEFVNHHATRAVIEVKMSGFVGPHALEFTPELATFRRPNGDIATVQLRGRSRVKEHATHSAEAQSVVLAYGATRLLPRGPTRRYGIEHARIDNLFDPFLPLFDADKWLMALDRVEFDIVAVVLKNLLGLDETARLIRAKDHVIVETNGDRVLLKQLSDGYQAVVAMSVDMLEVARRLWPHLEEAEGIVLLDEIGSHLHPAWKIRIVSSLRRAFPGVQFIVTTHEPLCLRGLGEDEVVVMHRDEETRRIEAVSGLPSPADFQIDQLLTSEFFGLNTTEDVETERQFDEYYALLAMPIRSEEQALRLQELRKLLTNRSHMGTTLRDQLMYEAVDSIVARHKHGQRRPMQQLKQEAVKEISDIWNATMGVTEEPA